MCINAFVKWYFTTRHLKFIINLSNIHGILRDYYSNLIDNIKNILDSIKDNTIMRDLYEFIGRYKFCTCIFV